MKGIVQGVGFRPFIFNLAHRNHLTGYVLNNTRGVDIEIEGKGRDIEQFLKDLRTQPPPVAVIEQISFEELPPAGYTEFHIKKSHREKDSFLPISPDIGTCDDCLRELHDPQDRRYRYPFINCTNCGPRFTIIEDIPYDRGRTTMSVFKMCRECESEYHNPANRRFHAQPNACWVCGPRVSLVDQQGEEINASDPISSAAHLINQGCIVAVKGMGGYHLACDATDAEVVSTLRQRKHRIDKPFALMMRDIDQVKKFCRVTDEEEGLLFSPRRPIVLLKKKYKHVLPEQIAPGNNYLGVMLPYTPLHYLLLEKTEVPLVMTSGNISEEPIAYKDKDALYRLGEIADVFLVHNREIKIRMDDSVTRVVEKKPFIIRRSRGYAPQPIKLEMKNEKCILALGGHLKNTFCILRKKYAIVSHHIGDLENLEALSALEGGVEHYRRIFYSQPEAVACDMHPNYASTDLAKRYAKRNGLPLVSVQHHHAHIVSLLAERQVNQQVIGVAFDGSGFGTDGTIWGGEFLVCDQKNFRRAAHLRYVPLPGGQVAIKEPWRMGLSYLYHIYGREVKDVACQLLSDLVECEKISFIQDLITKQINSPLTSSAGRLFDAASSLLGIRGKVNYEGQASVELEMIAEDKKESPYPFQVIEKEEKFVVDTLPVIQKMVDECQEGEDPSLIATRFHWTVSHIILRVCKILRDTWGVNKVALSGGVFQNTLLIKQLRSLLVCSGFEVFLHSLVPTNDGGISLGQAVVAKHRLEDKKYVSCNSPQVSG